MEGGEGQTHVGCVIIKRKLENKEPPEKTSVFKTMKIAQAEKERCVVKDCKFKIELKLSQKRCPHHAAKAVRASASAARSYVDYDYLSKLDAKEKAFLHLFTKDHYYGQTAKVFKITKKERRVIYTADHSRRRCVDLTMTTPLTERATPNPEDGLIALIDAKYKKP
jgi:hypothetical protein